LGLRIVRISRAHHGLLERPHAIDVGNSIAKESGSIKAAMMLALSLSLGATECLAAASKQEHVGDLICTIGDASPKAGRIRGLKKHIRAALQKAGGASVPEKASLETVNKHLKPSDQVHMSKALPKIVS
jgi:hypothetical protein